MLTERRLVEMFKQELLEEVFSNEEMQQIPCGCQSTAIHALETVIERLAEEKPYATVSELLLADVQ